MFVDLWSISVLVSDLFELIVNLVESEAFPISFSFLTFLIGFGILCYFSWRSTYIPELPTAPTPPYVIQITTTPSVQGDGQVNSLRDIRVLSNGGESAPVLRRFTGVGRVRISDARVVNSGESANTTTSDSNQTPTTSTTTESSNISFATWTGTGEVQQRVTVPTRITLSRGQNNQISQQQHPNNVTTTTSSSAILEVLRPTISRPFLQRAVNQANLILYHRINVYHHHHHHHHYPQSESSSPTVTSTSEPTTTEEERSNNQDTDTDSSSPSSIPDTSNQVENTQVGSNTTIEQTSEAQVQPVEIVLDSASSEDVLDIEQHSSEGLRQRRHVTFADPVDSETTETEVSMRAPKKDGQTSEQARGGEQTSATTANQGIDDDIHFTIKFLDDTQKEVTSHAGEKVLDFKRRYFAAELSENKTVRLIFNGRVLENDSSTLGELGIFEQCVVHCLIVNRQNPGGQSDDHSARGDGATGGGDRRNRQGSATEPGMFFVGFVGIFLVILWFVCFHFGNHLFSQSAVVSLTVLTAIFLIGLVAFYLPVHPVNPA